MYAVIGCWARSRPIGVASLAALAVLSLVLSCSGDSKSTDAQTDGSSGDRASHAMDAVAGRHSDGAGGVDGTGTAGSSPGGSAGANDGAAGSDAPPSVDASMCFSGGSISKGTCEANESYVAGKCVPCTATGEACTNAENYSNCCTRLGFDGVCSECTATDSACVAADCHDCCSALDAAGVCVDSCSPPGSACPRGDCAACCTGLEQFPRALRPDGVGVAGVCVECLENADCGCPSTCNVGTHVCECTKNGQRCAYDTCSDCCSQQSAGGQCVAATPECTKDEDCAADQQCAQGQCEDIPMTACTEPAEPCGAADCSDCCSGTGVDGVCD